MEQSLKRNFALFLFIILVSYVNGHKVCFEEERKGLLELKEVMGFMNQSSLINNEFEFLLPDWVEDEGKNECCEWSRVTCNHTTGHVIKISLGEIMYQFYSENSWSLNLSLFRPFKELRSLNLSYNNINGWTESEGLTYFSHLEILDLSGSHFGGSIPSFIWELSTLKALYLADNGLNGSLHIQGFASLHHLEILDLSWNDFGGSFPSFIWELSTLKALYLAENGLNGSLHIQGFASLHHLEILDLSWNDFGGSIPSFIWELSTLKALYLAGNGLLGSSLHIQGFTSLHHLEILDLSLNYIGGSIPSFISSLSSLRALSLAWNEINGSLPMQGFCELKKLQELDFSYNYLEGTLPQCLNNLTSLRLLDLHNNRFTGNISSSLIASLTSLEYIDLSHNHFEGSFSFSSFANHSKLQVVQIRNGNTKFEVETESIDWIPMFQLKSLVLSNCNLNNLSGEVPKFLLHQQRLRVLDLSGNQLNGRFPSWLLENYTELEVLSLRNNSFSGPFHLPTVRNLSVKWMDISNNHFNGGIQANIGQMLPYVYYLNLSRNDFHGGLPSSIGDMSELMDLDLSVNNFSGEFPNQVATGCTSFWTLVLSYNMFHGEFPLTHFNATTIWFLKLDNNQFTGKLSNDFTGFNNLNMLDISDNFLSGAIPNWISNYSTSTLVLRNNFFEGQISHLTNLDAIFIDFSYNSLTGSLPPFTKSMLVQHLHLQGNKFTGSIPESYAHLSRLLTLDLNDNNLSGNIPKFIGELPCIKIFLLGGNHFSGFIPNELCSLRSINLLDLSNNSLSGSIPKCLANIIGLNNFAFSQHPTVYLSNRQASYIYERILSTQFSDNYEDFSDILDKVDFRTKGRPFSYKGSILDFMSGLDLSCNNLTGEIPTQMGMLGQIHALNLSHNQLTGSIPKLFSRLDQIESLDLSFNSLSGEIPLELIDLTFLAVFVVAYNNLSGRVPNERQFGTFSKESYEGNPFLCGPHVEKNCTTLVDPSLPNASSDEGEEKWYEIDLVFFIASFVATYVVFLLGAVTILYINPFWRRRWFTLVEECMYSCYYFLRDFLNV